jgi:hypothetical protein
MALFTGAIADGRVGLHGIVGMGLGIAAGIVPMMLLRCLRRRQRQAKLGAEGKRCNSFRHRAHPNASGEAHP